MKTPPYYFYWNSIEKHVTIHYHDCGECNNGNGKHNNITNAKNGWEGPYDTYEKVYQDALSFSQTKVLPEPTNCAHCFEAH